MRGLSPALLVAAVVAAGIPAPAAADGQTIWERIQRGARDESAVLLQAGLDAEAAGDLERALNAYAAAQRATPDDPTPTYHALQALRPQPDEVLARTEALLPEASGAHRSRLLFYRAVAHLDRGELAEAADALERATRFRGDLPEVERYYANLGEIHDVLGQLDRAIAFYRLALTAAPEHVYARLGLAATLERLGRPDEARPHMQALIQRHDRPSFLDAPGVYFLRDGEHHLYVALFEEALGNFDAARSALARHEASAAAAATPDAVLAALRERMSRAGVSRRAIRVPGCQPVALDVTVSGERMAVICEGQEVREGPVVDDSWSGVGHANGSWNAYNLMDVAYVDANRIHVLRYDNVLDAYRTGPDRLELLESVAYNNYALTPQRLLDGGQRVVFSGANVAGVQWADWDASGLAVSLTYPTPSIGWLAYVTSSRDASRYAWSDGALTYVSSAGGQLVSTIQAGPSPMRAVGPALSPDGRRVATVASGRVSVHDATTGATIATLRLPGRETVTALTWPSDGRLAVGQFEWVTWYDASGW